MTNRLVVRAARLDDLGEIVELRLALLREYGDAPLYARLRPDVDDRARELYFAQLVAPNETMLLAERHGHLIGILRCVETTASPLLLPERYCYVSSVYVRPAERRRGVLRALVAAAERWCTERGVSEMRLHNSASSTVIGQVWESFGFEVVEHVRRRVLTTGRNALGSPPHAHAAHVREEGAR